MPQSFRVALLAVAGVVLVLVTASGGAQQASAQVSTMGEWSPPMPWPVAGVHAAVLPTGKVLHYSYPQTWQGSEAWLWDPQTGTLVPAPINRNVFCGAHSFLPDGKLLVTGGTDPLSPPGPPPFGIKDLHTFDPLTESWTYVGDTQVGRWYPTNVTLPDGRILILSGLDEQGQLTDLVEVFDPTSGSQAIPGANKFLSLYPWMHLLPSGKVFHAGPENLTSQFDPATATWETVAFNNHGERHDGTSVLLPLRPPDYRPRVMILGGDNPATNTAEIIDLGDPSPTWSFTASMNHPRHHSNAVLLPDGKLLAVGGTVVGNDETQAVLAAELFDPESETWTELASMQRPRIYHSTAVLLPDGRVLAAGTDGEFTAEIYNPPYLFQGPRPQIASAPGAVSYGSSFQVPSPNAQDIAKVVLIRPAAVTHSVNMEQRYVEVDFQAGPNVLTVQAPPGGNVAPPGYYMLFIVNAEGVPSEATFIRLGTTVDSDGDGLTDDDEINTYGTDPMVADTDGDGLSDGDELLVHGTDPLVSDTDDDGSNDGLEVFMGTDPLEACPNNSSHDAWPFDTNIDKTVNLADLVGSPGSFKISFGSSYGEPNYSPRFDFNADGTVNLADLVGSPGSFKSSFGTSCGTAPSATNLVTVLSS